MKRLGPWLFAVFSLMCVPVMAQDLSDVMDGRAPWPFDNMTAENVDDFIAPFIRDAENLASEEEKARCYIFLTRVVNGKISKPEAQHVAIALADKALSYDLSPLDRADVLSYKGSAFRKMHGLAKGDELREPRREVMVIWLEAYKLRVECEKTLEEEFRRDHPDFDPDHAPLPDPAVQEKDRSEIGWGPPREQLQARAERAALKEKYQLMERLQGLVTGYQNAFVDLYARAPYDLDELRALVVDKVGDEALADDLVERTKKEIAARLKMRFGSDAEKMQTQTLENIDAFVVEDAAEEAPSPPASATAPARSAVESSEVPAADGQGLHPAWLAAGILVAVAGLVVVTRMSRRSGKHRPDAP